MSFNVDWVRESSRELETVFLTAAALVGALAVGVFGTATQAAVPAAVCLIASVVLLREAARIGDRADEVTAAADSTAVVDRLQDLERPVRALGQATARWLPVWAGLYAAIGGIAPLVAAAVTQNDTLGWGWIAASAVLAVGATCHLISTERRVVRLIAIYETGVKRLEGLTDELTRPAGTAGEGDQPTEQPPDS